MDQHKSWNVNGMKIWRGGSGGGRGGVLAQLASQDASGGASSGITFDTSDTPGWFTYTAGNLTVTASGAQSAHSGRTKLTGAGKSSGSWYLEFLCNAKNSSNFDTGGVALITSTSQQNLPLATNNSNLDKAIEYAWNGWTGRYDTTQSFVAYRTAHAATNVIQMAVDITAKKMWWGLNNAWQGGGDPATATTPSVTWTTAGQTWWPAVFFDEGTTGSRPSYSVRTSAGSLSYTPPTGFTLWS